MAQRVKRLKTIQKAESGVARYDFFSKSKFKFLGKKFLNNPILKNWILLFRVF